MNISIFKMFYKSRKAHDIFLFIQNILSCLLLIATVYLVVNGSKNLTLLKSNTQTLYKVIDTLYAEEWSVFLQRPDNLEVGLDFYDWLRNHEQFDFLTFSRQNFYIESELFPDEFKIGYENDSIPIDSLYKSIQVDTAFLEHFSIETTEGRSFREEDYAMENERIPLLLGYEYRNYANIGDEIPFYYSLEPLMGEVIGFIEQDAYYSNSYDLQSLNRYIVMPALTLTTPVEELTWEERSFAVRVYFDSVNGLVLTDMPAADLQYLLMQKSIELDISPFALEGVNPFMLTMWGLEGEELQTVFVISSIAMSIISSMILFMYMANKISYHKKDIAIYRMNGISLRTIWINIILYISVFQLVGGGIGAMIFNFFLGNVYYIIPVLIVLSFSTVLISLFLCLSIKKGTYTKEIHGD